MPVNYLRIPEELRVRKEWLVWRYEDRDGPKLTKPPYNPKTGQYANVTDPNDWVTFDEAVAAVSYAGSPYNGIGFVFSKDSPYCGVDLDAAKDQTQLDRQIAVVGALDSYAERSPSGNGLHVIVKATIPKGCRRDSIEIYDRDRFFTMTGDVYMDKLIRPAQHIIEPMYEAMTLGAGEKFYAVQDKPQSQSDLDVIETAINAENGAKFNNLHDGDWQLHYSSQSEADHAYINIIAFYTQNIEQIKRIFWDSPLGQRKKARRPDYVDSMVNRAFDNQLPPVDFIGMIEARQKIEEKVTEQKLPEQPVPVGYISGGTSANTEQNALDRLHEIWTPQAHTFPTGFMGEIAQWTYDTSVMQVKPIALVAAMGLAAGICGRSYNVFTTGLNQYFLLLAPTAVGKEGINKSISTLISAVSAKHQTKDIMTPGKVVPAADCFVGPSDFASGQAVYRALQQENQRCFVSIIGEFGTRIAGFAKDNISPADRALKRSLLELYNKSGARDVLFGINYAGEGKSIQDIPRPAVSLIGESTPSTFYDAINEQLLSDGLLPRFTVIQHAGGIPPLNPILKTPELMQPPEALVTRLSDLCMSSLTMQADNRVMNVQFTKESDEFQREVFERLRVLMNTLEGQPRRELWTRVHMKMTKLAATKTVLDNQYTPTIEYADLLWSLNTCAFDISQIAARFSSGAVGNTPSETSQYNALLQGAVRYLNLKKSELGKKGVREDMHNVGYISRKYLQSVVAPTALFRNDPQRATNAFNRALRNATENGALVQVPSQDLIKQFNYRGAAYYVPNIDELPPEAFSSEAL